MIVYNEDMLDTASGYNKLHDAGTKLTGDPTHADRVARGLHNSSVTPAHMRGLQFIHLNSDPSPVSGGHANYDVKNRGINAYTTEGSWANHDDTLAFNINHEIGHHVAHTTHGLTGSEGYNEAVAENFAEHHSPKSDRIGDRNMRDVRSNYDSFSTDPTYHSTREQFIQPHERPNV